MLMGVLAMILGYTGYSEYYRITGVSRPALDIVFMTFQLFRMMFFLVGPFPWELEVARWLAAAVILYAAVRVILAIFYDQFQLLLLRLLVRDHVVICGFGQQGDMISREFYEEGYKVAIVEKSMSKEMAQKCRDRGAAIVSGSALDAQTLLLAGVDKCRYMITVMGDDGTNAEAALLARRLVEEKGSKSRAINCYVHITDRQLCNLLKVNYEFSRERWSNFRLEFFNPFDGGAKALLHEYPADGGDNMVIVGLNRIGESVLLQMAANWLSAHPGLDTRLQVSVVDRDALVKVASISMRYPLLVATCDIWAYDMGTDSPAFYSAPFLLDKTVGVVYICMENDQDSLAAALALNRAAGEHNSTIVACMSRNSGLSKLIKGGETMGKLHAFAMLEEVYKPESLLGGTREVLAMAIHEEYATRQRKLGVKPAENSSMESWSELPEILRESNRHSADAALVKLSAIGCGIELLTDASAIRFNFTPEEIEQMSVIEHQRWVDERLTQGWKLSPVKDVDKKLTPYLVTWEQLTEDIREYDRNVVRGMPMFLAKAGFQVYRMKKDEKASVAHEMAPVIS